MKLMNVEGKTFLRIKLLGDFRAFILNNFDEGILSKTYLAQFERIGSEFRNKAAHPYLLGRDVAEECRVLVRECLNKFILSYHSHDPKEVASKPSETNTGTDPPARE